MRPWLESTPDEHRAMIKKILYSDGMVKNFEVETAFDNDDWEPPVFNFYRKILHEHLHTVRNVLSEYEASNNNFENDSEDNDNDESEHEIESGDLEVGVEVERNNLQF